VSECPEEIEAEQSHPEEHGNPREIEWVPNGETGLKGDWDEELFGGGTGLIVVVIVIVVGVVVDLVVIIVVVFIGRDLNVVADHEEHGREED